MQRGEVRIARKSRNGDNDVSPNSSNSKQQQRKKQEAGSRGHKQEIGGCGWSCRYLRGESLVVASFLFTRPHGMFLRSPGQRARLTRLPAIPANQRALGDAP